MESILIGLFLTIMVLCLIALIKNQINYSIRIKWIDELYDDPQWSSKTSEYYQQEFTRLSYDKTFWDLTLWKHTPFKDYVKKNVRK